MGLRGVCIYCNERLGTEHGLLRNEAKVVAFC